MSARNDLTEKAYRKNRWKNYNLLYALDHSRNLNEDKELRWVIRLLQPKKSERILDVGCNTGDLCWILSQKYGAEAVGVDINKNAIRLARKRYPKIKFFSSNAEKLGPGKYDAIVMVQVIEHFKDPVKIIKKLHGALKENGRLVISTPNQWAYIDRLKCWFVGKKFAYDPTHCNEFTPPKIKNMLEKNGFEVKESITRGTSVIPFFEKLFNVGWSFPNWLIGSTIIVSAKKRQSRRIHEITVF